MHPGSTPHIVSGVLHFQQATSTNLQLASSTQRYPLHGGISKDGKVCWVYCGSILEVVSCNSRNCLAAWNFGNLSHDMETIIQCVSEFWTGDSLKLLIGLKTSSSSNNGLLCVLHIGLSKVVKAIEMPFPVTSVECVTSLLGNDFLVWSFSEQLSCFYGIITAGTEGGHVYLIDMCLDTYDLSDETFPNSLYYITPETDAVQARHEALSQRQVLCMELGVESFSADDMFNYQGNDENDVKQFNTNDISVTCLKYMSRNGLLAVGFSFGCFQLWRLAVPFLEYSSHIDDSGDVPITHIIYQEPENDPKFFTYIWVARGTQVFASDNGYVANISLYQLTFNKRMWQANEEYFYEEMTSIGIRLEHDLSCDPLIPSKTFSSNVISCFTLEDPNFVPSRIFDDSHEEVCSSPDLSLSVFVWKATESSKNGTTSYHLSIFDMNRWYHLQMPSTIRNLRSSGVCPFMAFCSLDEVVDSTVDDELLNIYINPSTVRRFICDPLVAQEQFFYPASLQFDVLCLMEGGLLGAKYLGMQRQVLNTIQKLGPSCLIEPTELYKMCVFVGLVHRTQDNAPQSFSIVGFQREALLSLCLEYHMVNVILKCIDEWGEGEFTAQKCTLKYLLDWSWNKVVQIKKTVDTTSKHFYDWSGLPIDDICIQSLHRSLQKFTYLVQIFHKFITSSVPTTENGIEELKQKLDALQLLSHHLKAVIWFVEAGLLPENDELANDTPGLYKYPRSNLFEEFSKRRNELKQLNSDLKPNELLMIDGLIANMAPAVYDVWKQDGGNELYPPPSINALLYIYLLEDVSLITKHCVVGYFFLDLASLGEEDNSKLAAKVTAFSQIFSVPPETMNLITGFWLLDHKDFEVAFYSLVKSSVFGQWQHRQVIKSLLYQEEYKLALQYLAVKKPPLSSPEEIKLKLTTFLFNGMTAQAVEFYRSCCNQTNAEDLISHIFLGCQQRKIMCQLVKLPLTEAEEKWLENYLMTSPELNSKEALVVYYLQRARYVDAIRLNEKLKSKDMSSMTEREKNMTSTRNIIVRNCLKLLPDIQRQFLHEPNLLPRKRINRVTRPKPLSTVVTKSTGPRVMSQSTLILAIMEKMDEVERLNNSANDSRSFGEELVQDSAIPFISAPFTPQKTALPNVSRFTSEKSLVKDPSFLQSLSNRKSILLSHKHTSAADEHFNYLEQPARRKSKYVSAEALSVLQTPVIQRKSTLRSKMVSPRPTPQSILKVRQMSSKSPNFNMSVSMDKDSSGFRNSIRSPRLSENDSLLSTPAGKSVKRTSKSLRFAEPASWNLSPNSSNSPYTSMSTLLSKAASTTEISAADRHQVMDNILSLLGNNTTEGGQQVTEMDMDGVEEEDEEEEEEEDNGSFIEEDEEDDYEEEHTSRMHIDDDDDDDGQQAAEKAVVAEVERVLAEVRKVKKREEEQQEMYFDDNSDDSEELSWQQAVSGQHEFSEGLTNRYQIIRNEQIPSMAGQTGSLVSTGSSEHNNEQVAYTTDSDDDVQNTRTVKVDSDIIFAFPDSGNESHESVPHTNKRFHIEVDTEDEDVPMEIVESDTDSTQVTRDSGPLQREPLPTAITTTSTTETTIFDVTTTTTLPTTAITTTVTGSVANDGVDDAADAGCYQIDDEEEYHHQEDTLANILLKHSALLLESSTSHAKVVTPPAPPPPPPIVDLTDDQDEEDDYNYDYTEGRQQVSRVVDDQLLEPEESDDILEICPLSGPQQPALSSSYYHSRNIEERPAEQILIDDDDEEEEEEEEAVEEEEDNSEEDGGFVKVEHVEEQEEEGEEEEEDEKEVEEERDDVSKASSVEDVDVRVGETEVGNLLVVQQQEGDVVSEAEYISMEPETSTDTMSQIRVLKLQQEHQQLDDEDNLSDPPAIDVISVAAVTPQSLEEEGEDTEMRDSHVDEEEDVGETLDVHVTSALSSENLTSFSLLDTSCISAPSTTRQEITMEAEAMEVTDVPQEEVMDVPQEEVTDVPQEDVTDVPQEEVTDVPQEEVTDVPQEEVTDVPQEEVTDVPQEEVTDVPQEDVTDALQEDIMDVPQEDVTDVPQEDVTDVPQKEVTDVPQEEVTDVPQEEVTDVPQEEVTDVPQEEVTDVPQEEVTDVPQEEVTDVPQEEVADVPQEDVTDVPQEVTDVPQEMCVAMTTSLQPEVEVAPTMATPTPMMEPTSSDLPPTKETFLPHSATNKTPSQFPTASERRPSQSRRNKTADHRKSSVRGETSLMEKESEDKGVVAVVGEKTAEGEAKHPSSMAASQSTPPTEFKHTLRKRTNKTQAVVAETLSKEPELVSGEEMQSQNNEEADQSPSPLPMRVLRSSALNRKAKVTAKLETPPPTPTHKNTPSAPQKSFIMQTSARRKTFTEESPTLANIKSKTQSMMEISLRERSSRRNTSVIPTDSESTVKTEAESALLTPSPSRRRKTSNSTYKTRSSQRISQKKIVSESFIESSLPVLTEDSPKISIELALVATSEPPKSHQKLQKRSTKNQSFVTPAATPVTRLRQQTSRRKDVDNKEIKQAETLSEAKEKEKLYSSSVVLSVIPDNGPLAAPEVQTPVRVRSTRRKTYLVNPVDSPIVNLLTPGPSNLVPQKSDSNKTKSRYPSPGQTLNQQTFHGMVLRQKTAPVKKRKL